MTALRSGTVSATISNRSARLNSTGRTLVSNVKRMTGSVWLDEARAYPNGVVATPHYLASAAGAAMLAEGGNAVDAALAANLTLAIVTPYMCGFGGDLLTIVWDGAIMAYRGVRREPAGSSPAAVRDQSGATSMPQFGPH